MLLRSKEECRKKDYEVLTCRWSFASPCLFVGLSARVSTPRGGGRRRDLRRSVEEYLAKYIWRIISSRIGIIKKLITKKFSWPRFEVFLWYITSRFRGFRVQSCCGGELPEYFRLSSFKPRTINIATAGQRLAPQFLTRLIGQLNQPMRTRVSQWSSELRNSSRHGSTLEATTRCNLSPSTTIIQAILPERLGRIA